MSSVSDWLSCPVTVDTPVYWLRYFYTRRWVRRLQRQHGFNIIMSTQKASESEGCPFCQIANNQSNTEILLRVSADCSSCFGSSLLYFLKHTHSLSPSPSLSLCVWGMWLFLQDDELLCFRDVKPGATHHYLVITRTHIDSCKRLQSDHIPLGETTQFISINRF